ncbi:hypothetical protein Calab_0583 [Caldithrix abyssi DSM 13497]|uniref:Right handed beta helix region n=1 Tax=Caldithrix abyssi DSM 13497 TaxID=880073 RepID=H1XS62_CALAY|nr:hypothetical protein [Caldithrix abyssi]APF20163.1 hypothetical protein Cabys_3417 [Caldithrix abyssi DSM 13497]EHO40226.1 hypothetical protein Calab_0583 [Caldithrix abyssi DSM 13497]
MENKKIFFSILLMIITPYLFQECKNITGSNKTISISGRVFIENGEKLDEVIIELYEACNIDTVLLNAYNNYQVGVEINQKSEFDHREKVAKYITECDANGEWIFHNIENNMYNVVVRKDSFGWIYHFNVNSDLEKVDTLRETIYINEPIKDDLRLKTNQFLCINKNTYLPKGNKITFSENNVILFKPNISLTIYGDLINRSNIKVTSFNIDLKGNGLWINSNHINSIGNIQFEFLKNPLTVEKAKEDLIEIYNIFVRNCENGIYIKEENASIRNSVFKNIKFNAIQVNNKFFINRCVIYKTNGIFFNNAEGVINNSFITKNEIGLRPLKGDVNIINNEFRNNKISISASASKFEVIKNDFLLSNLDIEMNKTYESQVYEYCIPYISMNNFFSSDTAISLYGKHSASGPHYKGIGVNKNVEAKNCYWGTANYFEITKKIYDKNDKSDLMYEVLFEPFEKVEIKDAGIKY